MGLKFSNTPPHAQHYWALCVDINGRWFEIICPNTILDFYNGSNSTLQNQFVKWGVPLFINYSQPLSLINMRLNFSNKKNHVR
jgi:hypothetical protein